MGDSGERGKMRWVGKEERSRGIGGEGDVFGCVLVESNVSARGRVCLGVRASVSLYM